MRLTKVVAWNEPLCQSEVSDKAKRSSLRARSPSDTTDAGCSLSDDIILFYSTRIHEIASSASFFISWSISASRATFAISI